MGRIRVNFCREHEGNAKKETQRRRDKVTRQLPGHFAMEIYARNGSILVEHTVTVGNMFDGKDARNSSFPRAF